MIVETTEYIGAGGIRHTAEVEAFKERNEGIIIIGDGRDKFDFLSYREFQSYLKMLTRFDERMSSVRSS